MLSCALEHGRAIADTRDLLVDGLHVLPSEVVGGADVVGPHNDAAGVLHLDLVRAERGDGIEGELLTRESDGGDEYDGRGANDHAEHGKQEAGFAGAKTVEGEIDGLAERYGGASAAEGAFEGVANSRHRQKDSKLSIAGRGSAANDHYKACLLDAARST